MHSGIISFHCVLREHLSIAYSMKGFHTGLLCKLSRKNFDMASLHLRLNVAAILYETAAIFINASLLCHCPPCFAISHFKCQSTGASIRLGVLQAGSSWQPIHGVTATSFCLYSPSPRWRYSVLQKCSVINSRLLANCCVWDCSPVEIHGAVVKSFRFPHVSALFIVYLQYGGMVSRSVQ